MVKYIKPYLHLLNFYAEDSLTDMGENGTGPSGVVGTVSDTEIGGDDDFWN